MSNAAEIAVASSIKLDIGCGAAKPAGWVGIDIAKVPGVDHVHDLWQFPWPVKRDSVSEAKCIHLSEHIPHREAPYVEVDSAGNIEMLAQDRWARSVRRWGHVVDLWWDFWTEVHRVLEPDGLIHVVGPYYSSRRADQDPTHERRLTEDSFSYLSQTWLEQNRCAYPFAADFEIVSITMLQFEEMPAGRTHKHDLNTVADIAVTLRAKKPSKCWWEGKSNA